MLLFGCNRGFNQCVRARPHLTRALRWLIKYKFSGASASGAPKMSLAQLDFWRFLFFGTRLAPLNWQSGTIPLLSFLVPHTHQRFKLIKEDCKNLNVRKRKQVFGANFGAVELWVPHSMHEKLQTNDEQLIWLKTASIFESREKLISLIFADHYRVKIFTHTSFGNVSVALRSRGKERPDPMLKCCNVGKYILKDWTKKYRIPRQSIINKLHCYVKLLMLL